MCCVIHIELLTQFSDVLCNSYWIINLTILICYVILNRSTDTSSPMEETIAEILKKIVLKDESVE